MAPGLDSGLSSVALRFCGCAALRLHGSVAVWLCGSTAVLRGGSVAGRACSDSRRCKPHPRPPDDFLPYITDFIRQEQLQLPPQPTLFEVNWLSRLTMLQLRSSTLFSVLSALPQRTSSTLRCLAAQRYRRAYSIQTDAAPAPKLAEIDPLQLSVTKTTTPKQLTPPEELVFGRTFTGICAH